MLKSIYTNTSNPRAILGLLVVTVGVVYCTNNADKIVDGAVAKAKELSQKGQEMFARNVTRRDQKLRYIAGLDPNGKVYDTKRKVWINTEDVPQSEIGRQEPY
jgi:hypothetical protein